MLERLSRFLFGTLRGRLIVGVAAVHAVMMTLFIADLTMRQRALLLERQTEQALTLSRMLATSAAGWIAAYDVAGMQELVELQRRYPELLFATLADERGRVLAHTDPALRGRYFIDLPGDAKEFFFSRTPTMVDVAAPAMVAGRHVGWARVGLGQKVASQKLAEMTASGAWYALAAIAVGSLIAWGMGGRITRRLYAVQKTINKVRAGDGAARSALDGNDEAAVMAREFDAMLDEVAERDVELRTSEAKYRSLIHKVQVAIVLHDRQGRILDSNPLARELLGLSEDQLLGRELIDPSWRFLRGDGSPLPVAEYPVSRVLATRRSLRGELAGIVRPDRELPAWVLIDVEPELDEAGEVALAIVSFVDITDRKRDEEALHRLNRELRAISNCNQVLMKASDEQALLSDVCRIVCEEAEYRMAWVGYVDRDDRNSVRPIAWAGAESGRLTDAGLAFGDAAGGQGPCEVVIRTGRSDCIQDFADEAVPSPWREEALRLGYRSRISLPLKDEEGLCFGVFNIYSARQNAFTPDETRLMEELAGDLSFGVTALRARGERKEAQRSVALLSFALDNVREAAFLIDEDARFQYVNEEACRALGYGRTEFGSMGVGDVDPDFPHAKWPAHWEELKRSRSLTFEGRHRCKGGRIIPVEINANFIEFDGRGYDLALVRDITERRRTEELMREAAARLNDAQRLAHVGSWELDLVTNAMIWSDEVFRILEIDPEQSAASYQALIGAVHPEDREKVEAAYAESLKTREPYSIDHRLLFPDGRVKYVHEQCQSYFEGDTPVRSMGTIQDITARKQNEEALVKLNEELDLRVRERTAELEDKNRELERANRIFVGRELRMIELKERLRALERSDRTKNGA